MLRVSELAERSGVPASTLRYYEERGILAADRSPAGYRLFDQAAVERLAFISTAKLLGLDLGEITEIMGLWEQGSCARVRADLRPRVIERAVQAQERTGELRAFADRLEQARAHLAGPDPDGPCDPSCAFLHLAAPTPVPDRINGLNRRLLPLAATDAGTSVACTLDSADQSERIARWRFLLQGARRTEIDGGLRLSPPEHIDVAELLRLVAAERECCAFLTFDLHLGAEVTLEVRAPGGARSVLDEVFAEQH